MAQTNGPRVATPPPPAGVFDEVSKAFASARETLSQFLELVSLEGRRAALSLAWMLVGALVAVIFIVTAWVGLMAAIAMYAISRGMSPEGAVLVLAVINVAAAAALLYMCIGLSRHLLFTATRRQFAGESSTRSESP